MYLATNFLLWCLWCLASHMASDIHSHSVNNLTSRMYRRRFVNLLSLVPVRPLSANKSALDKLSHIRTCMTQAGVDARGLVHRDLGSQMYNQLVHQWNEYPEPKNPPVILVPQKVSDVQAAVRCGRRLDIRIVPKGGGHSFEKYSYGDESTLMIDLQLLDSVAIDHVTETADVGPGTLLGPLAWKLYENGSEYAFPAGLCPSVGISLALGGGFGNLPRYFGLTSDAVLEMDVITPDGQLRTVNENLNPSLYWALRGGGVGASFGIVTRFKLKLRPAPARIGYSLVYYKSSEFASVFHAWQKLIASAALPNTINSVLLVNKTHATLEFVEVYPQELTGSVTAPILSKFPTRGKIGGLSDTVTYPEYLLRTAFPNREFYNLQQPADLLKIHRMSFTPGFAKTKSFFSGPHPLTDDEALSRFAKALSDMPKGGNLVMEAFGPGSHINRVAPNATAFVHRDSLYHATLGYNGARQNYETEGNHWLRNTYELITKSLLRHSESYQNYADADLDNPLQKHYGQNLARLVAIKRAVDPDNYFRSPESIPMEVMG